MRRFTLVELMIVVAIVMVLAAIAVPNFYEMQLKSREVELPLNVDGIGRALDAYVHAYDTIPTTQVNLYPDATPSKTARSWGYGSGFDVIGWEPDGAVRGSYNATASGAVGGWQNLDGDTCQAYWWDYILQSVLPTYEMQKICGTGCPGGMSTQDCY